MRGIRVLLPLVFLALAAAEASAETFPRPASLEPQIRFWRSVFGDFSKHQVVVHDTMDLDKVYRVLDFRPYADGSMNDVQLERLERAATENAIDEVRSTLRRLAAVGLTGDRLSPEERGILNLFGPNPSAEVLVAAAEEKRIRSQSGLRERFGQGLQTANRYFPTMERIFRTNDLPVELTRLPLIESCFDVRAYSKVGAAGIWQFMPKTGRLYKLRVTKNVDERRDPIASTRGAARFLDQLYSGLGSWPLAITAWNHGPGGMSRAVRAVGSEDIATIVQEYQGNSFGFASRNFYAEFLAALDVERHAATYFPEDALEPAVRSRELLQEAAATSSEGDILPAVARQVRGAARKPRVQAVASPAKAQASPRPTKRRRVRVASGRSGRRPSQPLRAEQTAKLPDA